MNENKNIPGANQISTEAAMTILNNTLEFQSLMVKYSCAIREVKTKLEVLNDDLRIKNGRTPIESISYRIKKPASILKKMQKKGCAISVASIQNTLNDIAGIRVVCSFIDDIYSVAQMLAYQDDITVIETKDYIKNPKENGYRSYHMIVEIPVFLSDKKEPMRVEVQIRTIAMDFWASLEHQLKYKQEIKNEKEIVEKLRHCANIISTVDNEMQNIRREIEENSTDEESSLFEKFEKLSFGNWGNL